MRSGNFSYNNTPVAVTGGRETGQKVILLHPADGAEIPSGVLTVEIINRKYRINSNKVSR